MRNSYIERLLDKFDPRGDKEDENYRMIGLLIFYSHHDGAEYMSEQAIMDAEKDS